LPHGTEKKQKKIRKGTKAKTDILRYGPLITSLEIGWEERLRNDLFCVEWSSQSIRYDPGNGLQRQCCREDETVESRSEGVRESWMMRVVDQPKQTTWHEEESQKQTD